ncbi:MAG: alpha/beta hydrolase [Candidatus Dormibacteraeota bacterium]|nr:alpha/beta hydrolase [Candidatus Dormibacteraeota bacterium]
MNEQAAWRSPALGARHVVDLAGPLAYFDTGSGPTVVFVHGLLTNANIWRNVVSRLAPAFRCVTLDLPLGGHQLPFNSEASLTPPALADLMTSAFDALSLEELTLVGNDTGGLLCQIAVTRHPERVGRLVLTSCDYRENFPPKGFEALLEAPKHPGGLLALLTPLRLRAARRLPQAYGMLTVRRLDGQASDTYVLPALQDGAVRHDLGQVLLNMETRYAVEAADRLHEFRRPALVAWSKADRVFPSIHAEALTRDLADARLEWIEDSGAFSPEDQPEHLARLIADFVGTTGRAPVGGA